MPELATDDHLIYVVDDDVDILSLVTITLSASGYQAKGFSSGSEALASLKTDEPDLIILDVVLPGPNGLEIARWNRQSSQVPILMLTIRDEIPTKLAALGIGADDYLTKPFQIEELVARVRAILRRTAPAKFDSSIECYRCGDLLIDFGNMHVTARGKTVQLTFQELAVLRVLVRYAGKVVSPRQLLQGAWGPEYGDEGDYVRTYIARLRKKLESDPQHPRYIVLEQGIGYRLVSGD